MPIHPITAFAVCSDSKIGKSDELLAASELAYPATTDATNLAKQVNQALVNSKQSPDGGMTVVFSTYQSIDVIAVAQNGDQAKGACVENPMPEFDLIICDEAHRVLQVHIFVIKHLIVVLTFPMLQILRNLTILVKIEQHQSMVLMMKRLPLHESITMSTLKAKSVSI